MDMSFARRGPGGASSTLVPDFATLVAVAVARQSASATSRALSDDGNMALAGGSLVTLFAPGAGRGSAVTGSFNDAVAALLMPRKPT